jgi:hypothetical protein
MPGRWTQKELGGEPIYELSGHANGGLAFPWTIYGEFALD